MRFFHKNDENLWKEGTSSQTSELIRAKWIIVKKKGADPSKNAGFARSIYSVGNAFPRWTKNRLKDRENSLLNSSSSIRHRANIFHVKGGAKWGRRVDRSHVTRSLILSTHYVWIGERRTAKVLSGIGDVVQRTCLLTFAPSIIFVGTFPIRSFLVLGKTPSYWQVFL